MYNGTISIGPKDIKIILQYSACVNYLQITKLIVFFDDLIRDYFCDLETLI